MDKKILSIFVCMLMIVSIAFSASGNLNIIQHQIEKKSIKTHEVKPNIASEIDWWPMFHHDLEHTGYSTSNTPDTSDIRWVFPYDIQQKTASSPAVVNDRVYFGENKVFCLDAKDGSSIWTYDSGSDDEFIFSDPTVYDGKVYIGAWYGLFCEVLCLDAAGDGAGGTTLIWSYPIICSSISPSFAVCDGKVYLAASYSDHGEVLCLDAAGDGAGSTTLIWSTIISVGVYGSPAVYCCKLYIGGYNGVYCLNAINGDIIWNNPLVGTIPNSPAIAYNKVYVGSLDDLNVYCLDACTGDIIWSYLTGGFLLSPSIYDGKVYIFSMDFTLYCLDAEGDGAGGTTLIWSFTTASHKHATPAIADGKVYFGSQDSNFYCLDSSTGNVVWIYPTSYVIWSSPAIANGTVYIVTNDEAQRVIAFGCCLEVEIECGLHIGVIAIIRNNCDYDLSGVLYSSTISGSCISRIFRGSGVVNIPAHSERRIKIHPIGLFCCIDITVTAGCAEDTKNGCILFILIDVCC